MHLLTNHNLWCQCYVRDRVRSRQTDRQTTYITAPQISGGNKCFRMIINQYLSEHSKDDIVVTCAAWSPFSRVSLASRMKVLSTMGDATKITRTNEYYHTDNHWHLCPVKNAPKNAIKNAHEKSSWKCSQIPVLPKMLPQPLPRVMAKMLCDNHLLAKDIRTDLKTEALHF